MGEDSAAEDLRGTCVLITGATSGLGLEASKAFYKRGATVIMTCRDHVRGRDAVAAVRASAPEKEEENEGNATTCRLHLYELDLTDYRSVLRFTEDVKKDFDSIDVVICNAGVMGLPYELSRDGIEKHFHSNHFGHYVMVNQLAPLLKRAKSARVINVSSGFYKKVDGLPAMQQLLGEEDWDYAATSAYAYSKLANCLYTKALARRLEVVAPTITTYALRPGFVRGTELGRETNWLLRALAAPLIWFVSKSPAQGIVGYMHTATAAKHTLSSGALYHDTVKEEYTDGVTEEEAEKLWSLSMQMEDLIVRRRNDLTDEERRLYQDGRKALGLC